MKTPACLLALLTILALTGCQQKSETDAEAPSAKVDGGHISFPDHSPQIAAFAAEPVANSTNDTVRLSGRLVWDDDVTVRIFAPFAGRVTQITADIGQSVHRQDTLAMIASPDYGQAQADDRKAASDLLQAEKTLKRLHELYDHGATAKKDLEVAEADFARALSEKSRTAARLTLYGGVTETVDQLFPLKSPLDGVIVEKNINPGQEIRPDQMLANAPQLFAPLFVVTDPDQMWIQLDATEYDLPHLKTGQAIVVRSPAYPGQEFAGKIEVISDSLDPATRTVKARGRVDNRQHLLKAEMFITAEITATGAQGISLSSKAVFLKGEKHYLYLEDQPGKYTRQEVKVAPAEAGRVRILDGLKSGQRVVADGCLLLEELFQSNAGS